MTQLADPFEDGIWRFVASGEAESLSAQDVLAWAIESFHPRIALSASFGAQEGMVVLDMLCRIEPEARVFVLDTGRLPQAVYDLIHRVRERYDKQVEVVFPRSRDIEAMVREKGPDLFYESVENRKQCCRVRKVEPLNRYLSELDGWITGLRREQCPTRADTPKVEIDEAHGGILKVNPIADWSLEQVLAYVRSHNVPVNRLHGQGYPSVGCAPCSRAIRPGDDLRAGRWWWERNESKECGIHAEGPTACSGVAAPALHRSQERRVDAAQRVVGSLERGADARDVSVASCRRGSRR